MDSDDQQIGHILNRRDTLKILGVGGAAFLAACTPGLSETLEPITSSSLTPSVLTGETAVLAVSTALPACVVRPALTEGPYFVDEMLNRSDIRSDPSDGAVKEGALLSLAFNVSQVKADGCTPLPGAQVDIWHCDALGVYSDAQDPGFDTTGKKFLRGYQLSDSNGAAQFLSIYPGWYRGRTVHIHFKIRINGYDFTSQLFFDDSFTDQVYSQAPYAQKGERILRNEGDGIFQENGSQLLLNTVSNEAGYAATFDIGLQI